MSGMSAAEIRRSSTTRSSTSTGTWPSSSRRSRRTSRRRACRSTHPMLRAHAPRHVRPDRDWHALTPEERAERRVAARPVVERRPQHDDRPRHRAVPPTCSTSGSTSSGIDFSVVYPSLGLVFLHTSTTSATAAARAARSTASTPRRSPPFADRLIPVAAIPMHTPDEAVAELEYAVRRSASRRCCAPGYVQRPIAAARRRRSRARAVRVVARQVRPRQRVRLRPGVGRSAASSACRRAFHSAAHRAGSTGRSISSYVYNHVGMLAEGQHALGQVAVPRRRHPPLPRPQLRVPRRRRRVGGVALRDLIGHWEKRNRAALRTHLDPAHVDRDVFAELLREVRAASGPRWRRRPDAPAAEHERMLDEFAAVRHRARRGHQRPVRRRRSTSAARPTTR